MIIKTPFGVTARGYPVARYTMKNPSGLSVSVLDYGGIIQSILTPDVAGNPINVVLGYDNIASYEADNAYIGAIAGRYANRIAGAVFSFDGKDYPLTANEGTSHLHGSLSRSLFSAGTETGGDFDRVTLRRRCPAGEEGFPGTLELRVDYTLTADGQLCIVYEAESDADTVLNLTNHSYFNLNGTGDVLDHSLWVDAGFYTPLKEGSLPTGEILSVEGTPLDFRQPKAVGRDIGADWPQLTLCGGYDHNLIFSAGPAAAPRAVLQGDRSGIVLTIYSTEPAVQIYTGNFLGTDSAGFPDRAGVALETQHYPDAPHFAHFPSTLLRRGERFVSQTRYFFSTL